MYIYIYKNFGTILSRLSEPTRALVRQLEKLMVKKVHSANGVRFNSCCISEYIYIYVYGSTDPEKSKFSTTIWQVFSFVKSFLKIIVTSVQHCLHKKIYKALMICLRTTTNYLENTLIKCSNKNRAEVTCAKQNS